MTEFEKLVLDMRTAQKNFFRYHDPLDLRKSKELERKVDSGKFAVAFSMYPTLMQEVMTIADAGKIMPPKSTWFEPKLRDGIVVHLLEDL